MYEELWKSLGTTRVFDVGEHLIWITSKSYDDIETPLGYKVIKEDYEKIGVIKYPRVFFTNVVPIVAELFKNTKTREISYYFAGEPIEKDKQMTLK